MGVKARDTGSVGKAQAREVALDAAMSDEEHKAKYTAAVKAGGVKVGTVDAEYKARPKQKAEKKTDK